MNRLIVESVSMPDTSDLIDAKKVLNLCIEEIERAEIARREADKQLRLLIANHLNNTSLKAIEGELIKVMEYDLMYFYHNETWEPFPLLEDL